MSREIKFRVWTGTHWLKPMELAKQLLVGSSPENYGQFSYGDYEMSEYTGLKDKNGTEIYEGDILKGFSYEDEPYEVELFPDGSFEYSVAEWGHSGDDFEVIGNVYENPELLK